MGSENEDDTSNGDEGATFDPIANTLAAETVRSAGTKNMRPRRCFRIFVKGDDLLEVVDLKMLSLRDDSEDKTTDIKGKDPNPKWFGLNENLIVSV